MICRNICLFSCWLWLWKGRMECAVNLPLSPRPSLGHNLLWRSVRLNILLKRKWAAVVTTPNIKKKKNSSHVTFQGRLGWIWMLLEQKSSLFLTTSVLLKDHCLYFFLALLLLLTQSFLFHFSWWKLTVHILIHLWWLISSGHTIWDLREGFSSTSRFVF